MTAKKEVSLFDSAWNKIKDHTVSVIVAAQQNPDVAAYIPDWFMNSVNSL